MGKSILKNYIYNTVLTILNIIFPIITFPYISRVLGVDGVGKINFSMSIVNYFVLLASLGIPVYGIREISKVRDDREKVSKVYSEIYTINLISTVVFSVLYYVIIFNSNSFNNEIGLFSIMGLLVILNLFNIDWLYQGFEDYKYIAIRSIVFKVISIVAMFILVKRADDYIIYGFISVIALAGANIINIFRSKRYVDYKIRGINIARHYKQVLIIFFMGAAINIYNNLDSSMLGLITGDASVGYYSAATKINRMVINIITSLGVVLLPRLSNYIEKENYEEFNKIIGKSTQFIFFIGIPACVGLYILAPNIIWLFSGNEFMPAVSTMRINIPVIFLVALANITSLQILLPLKKEKQVAIAVGIAAITNFALNLVIIPKWGANGAAFTSTMAELIGLSIQLYFCKKYINIKIFAVNNLKYLFASVSIVVIVSMLKMFITSDFLLLLASGVICAGAYVGIMILIKDEFMELTLRKFKLKK